MSNFMKKWKNEKGSFSIEAVIAMTVVLMVTFLGISYFTYLAPRQMITQDVHMLAQTAKIQGGLTDEFSEPGRSDVYRFKERMEAKGYNADDIVVTAKRVDVDGNEFPALGVEPLSENIENYESVNYSRRNSKETITIHVTVPAKKNFINAMSRYFTGGNSGLSDYKFSETIMSERW